MINERIKRVINNHQMSCGHAGHYLYLLKGFNDFIDKIEIPVDKLDKSKLDKKLNFYCLLEDAYDFDVNMIESLDKYNYEIWTIDYNLFKDKFLSNTDAAPYETTEALKDKYLVTYCQPEWFEARKNVPVFNLNNSLTGIVEDPDKERNNEDLLELNQSFFK